MRRLSSPRFHGYMVLLFEEAGANDADSSLEDALHADDRVSSELLYLVETSRRSFCASSNLAAREYRAKTLI